MRKGTVEVNCVNKRGDLNVAGFLTLSCVSESNVQRTMKCRKQHEKGRKYVISFREKLLAVYFLLCFLTSWVRN